MFKKIILSFFIPILTLWSESKPIRVVTTTGFLASITKAIGNNQVQVIPLVNGKGDLHFQTARPDYILKANQADLFIQIGLGLESGWVPAILKNSKNKKIWPNNAGHLNASQGIAVLGEKTGKITRASGDVHPEGNPHYWIDPLNGVVIANSIRKKLTEIMPSSSKKFHKNFLAFKKQALQITQKWKSKFKNISNRNVMEFHSEFQYFTKRFSLNLVGAIEEIPGVPPSPARIIRVIKKARAKKVALILATPNSNLAGVRKVAQGSNSKYVVALLQCKYKGRGKEYLKSLEKMLSLIHSRL